MSSVSVLTIYPTALKVEDVLTARARAGDVSLGHRLTTFPELVDALDRETDDRRPVVADALALLVMQDALVDVVTLGGGERPGVAPAALRAIGELKAACIGPTELAAIAAGTAHDDVRKRLRWLARLAAGYTRRLARRGVADRHDRDRRVLDLLHGHVRAGTRPRVLVGVERLVIAEIYDYSPVQSLVARALITLIGDAELVTLAHPENVDASRFIERTWNRFVEDPAIADKVLPDFVVRGGRAGALARVLASVFVEPKSPPLGPAEDGIRIAAAPSRAAEVEDVGRRIRAALVDGAAPSRIAVLARDLAVYRALLEDVARRYRLPLVVAAPRALGAHASVQAALALLRAVTDGLPRDAVTECLASTYLPRAPRGVRRFLRTIGYVDAETVPLARCLAHAEGRLERPAAPGEPPGLVERRARDLARVRRDGPAVAAAVDRLIALAEPRTVSEHARALLVALAAFGYAAPSADRAPGEAPTEGTAITVLARLLEDVVALAPALDGRRVPPVTFLARLEEAIDAADVDAPGPGVAGVRALAIADARGLDFDDVYLVGLEDGAFPAPLVEDPLLDDRVRREINAAGPRLVRAALAPFADEAPLGRLLRTSADRAAEDPFLFYLALSTAERRLLVTHPARDDRGEPVVRSPFVDELVAILGDGAVLATADDLATAPATCGDMGELLGAGVVAAAAGRPALLAAIGARLPPHVLSRLIGRIRVERRRARYFLLDRERDAELKETLVDAFVGRLPHDPALRDRLVAMEWSATRIEELGACGFKFLAHRLLRLEPDEPGAEALDAREEGTLVHRLLEAVLRTCHPLPASEAEAVAAACAVAAAERPALAAEMRASDPGLFELAWSRALEALIELVRIESGAVSTGTRRFLEWPFRVAIADHRADAGDGRLDLTLTGVVDRADLRLDDAGRILGATVIDYKNGKRESDFSARLAAPALGTTSFQIPLYALAIDAAPDLVWAPGAEIIGGYVPLRSQRKGVLRPMPHGLLTRDPAARAAAGADAPPIANRIIALVAEAAAGRFDVAPRACDPYCAYSRICRYEPPPEEDE